MDGMEDEKRNIIKRLRRYCSRILHLQGQLKATLRDMPIQIHLTENELQQLERALEFDDGRYWICAAPFVEDETTPGMYVWHNPYHAE